MAKKSLTSTERVVKPPQRRKGIVSKNNSSNQKNSKNYFKKYRGQGR